MGELLSPIIRRTASLRNHRRRVAIFAPTIPNSRWQALPRNYGSKAGRAGGQCGQTRRRACRDNQDTAGVTHMNLTGKTAVVTGGGTGIGWAIAKAFHDAGAKVGIAGRRIEKLTEAAQQAAGENPMVCHTVDVADRDSVSAMMSWMNNELGADRYPGQLGGHKHSKPHHGRDGAGGLGPRDEHQRHRGLQLYARRAAANARASRRADHQHLVDRRQAGLGAGRRCLLRVEVRNDRAR